VDTREGGVGVSERVVRREQAVVAKVDVEVRVIPVQIHIHIDIRTRTFTHACTHTCTVWVLRI
jgi:hypothetical protein